MSYSVPDIEIDSLPYVDRELDTNPGLRASLENVIEAELHSILPSDRVPLHPSLASSSPPEQQDEGVQDEEGRGRMRRNILDREPFEDNPVLARELERVMNQEPLDPEKGEGLDKKRFSLPEPSGEDVANPTAWRSSLSNSLTQLSHQSLRQLNLSLLQNPTYGAPSHQLPPYHLAAQVEELTETRLPELKERREEINRERKRKQLDVGGTGPGGGGEIRGLKALEKRWAEGVSRLVQVDVANEGMEGELRNLRIREEEVRKRLRERGIELPVMGEDGGTMNGT